MVCPEQEAEDYATDLADAIADASPCSAVRMVEPEKRRRERPYEALTHFDSDPDADEGRSVDTSLTDSSGGDELLLQAKRRRQSNATVEAASTRLCAVRRRKTALFIPHTQEARAYTWLVGRRVYCSWDGCLCYGTVRALTEFEESKFVQYVEVELVCDPHVTDGKVVERQEWIEHWQLDELFGAFAIMRGDIVSRDGQRWTRVRRIRGSVQEARVTLADGTVVHHGDYAQFFVAPSAKHKAAAVRVLGGHGLHGLHGIHKSFV
jgi:nucleotide-binding universal stress UspA family protein